MEPAGKRRKLAPRPNASASSPVESHSHSQSHSQSYSQPHPQSSQHHPKLPHPSHIVPDAPRHSQRQEFEAFARHLHDAAVLINRQSDHQSRYSEVSVLLLSWQDDSSASENIRSLQQVLEVDYRYRTQTWQIPTVSNPSIKLGVQMASFLEHARPDELLIIYYSGHGFVGSDGQLYWACSPQDESARLKWDGVRCLFEEAQSDMLLLLDTCSVPDSIASTHGVKQVVAAYSPETAQHATPASRAYFTPCLTAALRKLSGGSPFSVHALCHQIKDISIANSNSGPQFPSNPLAPEFFTMTPDKLKNIHLSPRTQLSSNTATPETAFARLRDQPPSPGAGTQINFEEERILVCTTFGGNVSPDMSAFHSWLQNTPPLAGQVTVEGMFLGPSTILLISMPSSLWEAVRHDNIWHYLGLIKSRNMASLYEKLVGPPNLAKATPESSSITLPRPEPSAHRHSRQNSNAQPLGTGPTEPPAIQTSPSARMYQSLAAGGLAMKPKTEGPTDSAEMQEAAEQLKALSHVRHRSGDTNTNPTLQRALPEPLPGLHPGFRTLTRSESMPVLDSGTGSVGAKIRRLLGKPDIRCAHCTHAPFKDSSSLRKHIAAAHTRPFPCAFHFGGCTSTFGSKNEWKRHIASQHLCLQYYRCSMCARTAADGKGNEFNRKDLFTQHLRRMHAPPEVKRALAKGDNAQQTSWDDYVKGMQQSCLIQRRHPPQRSNCPKPGCQSTFEGITAWDEWTEHVGRHMEKGEGDNLGVDALLRQYAIDEGIIERIGENQYRLCPTMANGGTVSQPASQAPMEMHDSQPPPMPAPMSTQGSMVSTSAALPPPIHSASSPQENPHSQPWGPRSLPPLPPHPPHMAHDRRPSQPD